MQKIKQIVISIITITMLLGIQNTSIYGYAPSSSVLSNAEPRAVTTYDISKNNVNIKNNGNYIITGTNKQNNFNHITVSGNITANITIRDLWIYLKDSGNRNEFLFGAIDLQNGATVNLTLEGTNYLKGSRYGAGIQVPKGTTLKITKESTGSLEAHGGSASSGIGAAGNQNLDISAAIRDLGTIIIDGGTVKAYGNATGVVCPAGIGGSDLGTTGKIVINGGNIMATHEKGDPNAFNFHAASGIGGGYAGKVEEIEINGGTINATGASGIGNGFWGAKGTFGCAKITITGGDITANAVIDGGNMEKPASIGSGGTRKGGGGEIIGDIKITGGQFNLNKGVYPQPKDENNNNVYPLTLQVKGEQIKKDETMNADLSLTGDNYSQTVSGLNFKSNEDTISTSWQVYLASRNVKATLKSDNGIYQKAFNMPNQATTVLLDAGLYAADLYFNDYRINETSNFKSFSVKQNGTTLTSDNLIYNDHLEILDGGRAKFKIYAPANSGSTTINAIINDIPGVWKATKQSIVNGKNIIQMEFENNCDHDFDVNGFCKKCGDLQPADKVGDVYEMKNQGQLYWFSLQVNYGNNDINGKLIKDINMASINTYRGIGTVDSLYQGQFDGNGHTINIDFSDFKVNNDKSEGAALFKDVTGNAVIKDLTVTGKITSSAKFASGLVSSIQDNGSLVTIERCISKVNLNHNANLSDLTWGGLVGLVDSGTVNINNCAYLGTMTATESNGLASIGGLIGYNKGVLNIDSSYVNATFAASSVTGENISRNNNNITNTYYINNIGSSTQGIKKTTNELVSGELTWLLNGSKNAADPIWRQTIGVDDYPNFTGKVVYMEDDNYTNKVIKLESTLEITSKLDKVYSGKEIADPEISKTGSTGKISFVWYQDDGTGWKLLDKTPSDVGRYKVEVILAADDLYEEAKTSKEFLITQADSTIELSGNLSKSYDGTAVVEPAVTKTGSTGEVTYNWYENDGTDWKLLEQAPIVAGRYKVEVLLAGDTNYEGAKTSKEYLITQADSTITISGDLSKSYDGTAAVEPAVTKTGSTGEVTFKWYQGDKQLDGAPVNAGKYKVVAELAGDRNHSKATSKPLEFTISKAQNSFSETVTITGWTYGQAINEPTGQAVFGKIDYTYCDTIDGTYGKLPDAPHAGTWYVKAVVKGTDNYEGLVCEPVAFEINKAAASDVAEPENLEGIYGQTLKDVKLSDGWKWVEEDTALTVVNNGYMARIKVDDMNYDYSSINGYAEGYVNRTLKVTVAQVENSWIEELEIEGWTYGEAQNSATAKSKYGTVKYTYRDEENNAYETMPENAHAGTWVAIATVEATVDYKGLEASKQFTISKAASTIKITNDLDKIYDGNAAVPAIEKTGSTGEVTYNWYENDGTDWKLLEQAPVNVGKYKIEVNVATDTNYKGAKTSKEYLITQADSTITISGDLSKSYDGTAVVEPAVTKTGSTGEVTFKWYQGDKQLDEAPVNPGKYKVIAILDSDRNYHGNQSNELDFEIFQAANSWVEELNIKEWTYGKTQNSATAKPKFGTVKYTYTDEENNVYETMPKNAHAGIWTVKAVVEATTNYQSLEAIKTFKILKAESTITIKDDLNKIYDGSAVVPTVEKTGSSGEVTYKWYEYDESGWSEMTTAPVEAGRYRVNAILAEDINYNGKVYVAKEFIISKAASTLKLSGDLNKSYDGTAVVEPAVTKTGSTGEVTFKWYQGDKELDTAPVNVGSYSVKAYLAGDRNYDGVTSKSLSFEITKADNSFITALTIANWTYGETPNQPVCVAQFGEVKYTYNDSIDGTYGKLPDDPHAGTWYVKAAVKGTDNYEGLVCEPVAFEINKAAASDVAEPENLEGIYGQTLKDVKLSDGWKWVEEDTALTVVNNGYMARIKVDDMNYDYSSINGYAEGYVNRILKVTVAQVENSWIEELEIEGWTYGKTQNSAKAKAKYGTVKYTYRDEENNVYETMPENAHAGTWVAIATVEATVDYKGLEATKVFNIEKAASTIKITNDLDKIYDGNAVVPTVEKTGSSGEVSIIWYENDGSRWNVIESAPSQVGRYKVEAVLSEDINYNSAKSQAKEFIISKADSTIAVSGDLNKSYDGTAVAEPVVTKTGSTGEVTFKWYQGDKQLDQAPINAGSYSVKAYLAGDRNFNSCESNQIDFVIAKADTQLEFTNNLSKEYDGIKAVSPEINKVGNTNQLKIKWHQKIGENWQEINNAPVNAGLYKVEASIAADNNYNEQKIEQEFTIAQAKNSWVEQLAISDWTYGQKADTAVGKAKFGTVVFMYTAPDGKEYSSIPEGAIAGTWTLKAKVDETENYQGLEDSLQFTINKAEAPIIVEPDNLSAVQDDQLESVQLPKGWSWVEPQDTVTVSVSSYQAKLKVEDDKNYDYSPVAGYKDGYVYRMLNIAVAQGENNWVEKPNIKGWTYGQKANDPTGSAAHGEITYTYSDSITGIFTNVVPNNAGTWYMKASVPVSDEYTGLNEIIEFTIAKAIPEYSLPEGLKANYDQNLSDIELPEGFTWQEEKLFDQVGKYTFKLTYTPEDQENYQTVKDIEIEVTVKQAKNEWLEELNLDGWVYGEEANKPIAQAKYGEIYYVYSKTKDGQYTTKQPNEAGVWYVKAIVDETDNYAGIESKAVEFIIEQKDAENNVVVPDIKNDNDVNNLVIKDGDKVLVDGIDYEITKIKSGNTVTVTITFKGNYKGTIVKTYQLPVESVNTGDEINTGLWIMMVLGSIVMLIKGRKKEENQ